MTVDRGLTSRAGKSLRAFTKQLKSLSELGELLSDIGKIEEHVGALEALQAELEARTATAKQDAEAALATLAKLSEQHQAADEALAARISEGNAARLERDSITAEVASLKATLVDMAAQRDADSAELAKTRASIALEEDRLARARKEAGEAEARAAAVKRQMAQLADSIQA